MTALQHFLLTVLAVATGLSVTLLGLMRMLRSTISTAITTAIPEPPEEPTKMAVYIVGDRMAWLDIHQLRDLASALLRTGEPVVHTQLVGREGDDMAWRGAVWDSFASIRARYLDPAEVIPGVVGQPYWLCNAPTEGEARERCEDWLAQQFMNAVMNAPRVGDAPGAES